jgi:hypothetical protein
MSRESSYNVYVSKERYLEILGFTTYVFVTGKIGSFSGFFGGKRTLGQFLENFIYGKIAEEGLKEFLKTNFGLQVLTDVDIADFIEGMYLPDIVAIKVKERWETAKFWIETKEVRRDQKWFLVPASATRQRPYDAYVAVWVGLPDDHIAWLIKNVPQVAERMSEDWQKKMKELEETIDKIPCKIIGYALWEDVVAVSEAYGDEAKLKYLNEKFDEGGWYFFDGSTALFDPDDPQWSGAVVGENVGFALSRLEKGSKWDTFVDLVEKNERTISERIPVKGRTGLPSNYKSYRDYREASFRWLSNQLEHIQNRFGNIQRKSSWFTQKLPKEWNKII